MFIMVVYDISDNKKRTRLHKTLRRYGDSVQYSAFECIISEEQFRQMRKEVEIVLGEEARGVRYYDICEECHRKVKTFGRAKTTSLKPVYII